MPNSDIKVKSAEAHSFPPFENAFPTAAHLCTSAELGTAQILEYLQGELVRQLDIEEGNVVDFILQNKEL